MIKFRWLLIFCVSSPLLAQENLAEKLLENQQESSEQSELYEILLNLKESPLDLNSATYELLELIPGLTPALREEIVRFRQQLGRFKTVEELLLVPGMDSETFEYLRELVYVKKSGARIKKPVRFQLRSRVSDRIDRPIGFENGAYLYSPQKIYHRVQYQISEKIAGGVLLEKDSGERRWDDLRLYHVSMQPSSNLSLLIGHYLVEIGQGLIMWGPYGFSKGADAVFPIKKRARQFRGYTSVDENAALQGGVVRITLNRFHGVFFGSRNKLDATPLSEDDVSGLAAAGFHRNENELEKKDLLTESLLGTALRYSFPHNLTIGVSGYYSEFDKTIADPDVIRQRFAFRGKTNAVVGLDWNWRIHNANMFGESARSKNGGRALLTGALIDFKKIQLALLFRDYGKDFQNLHGFGFADANGSTQNERGYYTGIHFKIAAHTNLSAYYDIFTHPWRTFFEPLPFEGHDFLSQLDHNFSKQLRGLLRFRENRQQKTAPFKDELSRAKEEFVEITKRQWRMQLDYELSPQLRWRSRFEYVHFNSNRSGATAGDLNEQGFSMYQDFRIRPLKSLTLSARLTFFDTDSFDSAVFQYENDLPGLVTNRGLFGEGTRWYVLVNYHFRFMNFAAKYSETFRDDTERIGSGADQIAGQLDRRFGVQLDMKF